MLHVAEGRTGGLSHPLRGERGSQPSSSAGLEHWQTLILVPSQSLRVCGAHVAGPGAGTAGGGGGARGYGRSRWLITGGLI